MPNVALIPALAKLLLAIAWADGELHPEEEATVKEVLGLLPELSAQEWAIIELYLAMSVTAAERATLLQLTLDHIRSAEDKRIALEAVDVMLNADGAVQPGELAAAQTIRQALAAVDVSPLGRLRRAVNTSLHSALPREASLDLWRTNPVYYLVRSQIMNRGGAAAGELEVAALAAGIMAQIVRLAPNRSAALRPVLVEALHRDWYVSEADAALLAEAAIAITRRNVDYHRISRELARRATETQRVALLATLFTIANAADHVAPGEIDEIRVIAERLNLTRHDFIAAKLKIPAADRGGL